MENKNIDDLRQHLFATIEALSDKEKPMAIDRADAISKVAQVIINSAMVEVKYAQVTGHKTSTFISNSPKLPPGINGITQHKIR